MPVVTQPIRDEHRELMPYIETLRQVADSVGISPGSDIRRDVEEAYDFLAYHLIPHASAEDDVLYPRVAALMGAPEATATMSRDHVEVGRLTKELKVLLDQIKGRPMLMDNQAQALRRVLYGLYALVSVHFAKEEEIYLPLLDAKLSQAEARKVFAAMENVAREAKERARRRHTALGGTWAAML